MKKVAIAIMVLGLAGAGIAYGSGNQSSENDCQIVVLDDGSELVQCNDGSAKLIAMARKF